jgi:predicted secreted protein
MQFSRISEMVCNDHRITNAGSMTFAKLKSGETLRGYFQGKATTENRWQFFNKESDKLIQLNGVDIESLSLGYRGRIVYKISDSYKWDASVSATSVAK